MKTTLLLAALLCGAAPGAGAQVAVRYALNIPGTCQSAWINGEDHTRECRADHLVNAAYTNGRAMFAFNMGTVVAFAGTEERQPATDRYLLRVSNLNVAGARLPAKGTCTVEGKLKDQATVTCQAKSLPAEGSGEPPFEARIVYRASGEAQPLPGN